MRKSILWSSILALLVSVSSQAKLDPISWEEFRSEAPPCGIVVSVEVSRQLREEETPPEVRDSDRFGDSAVIEVRFRVAGTVGPEFCCRPERELTVYFADEIHSSHPEQGQTAIVFLASMDGYLVEAVYGRSYWVVLGERDERAVLINWRNEFLLEGRPIFGQRKYLPVPWHEVVRKLGRFRPLGVGEAPMHAP